MSVVIEKQLYVKSWDINQTKMDEKENEYL